jgi:hypothetical protein
VPDKPKAVHVGAITHSNKGDQVTIVWIIVVIILILLAIGLARRVL